MSIMHYRKETFLLFELNEVGLESEKYSQIKSLLMQVSENMKIYSASTFLNTRHMTVNKFILDLKKKKKKNITMVYFNFLH